MAPVPAATEPQTSILDVAEAAYGFWISRSSGKAMFRWSLALLGILGFFVDGDDERHTLKVCCYAAGLVGQVLTVTGFLY